MDELAEARAILDRIFQASLYSRDARPALQTIDLKKIQLSYSQDGIGVFGEYVAGHFDRNPVRLTYLSLHNNARRNDGSSAPLPASVLDRIASDVAQILFPGRYSPRLVNTETSGEYHMRLTHQGIPIFTGWGISLRVDSFSGALAYFSDSNSTAIDRFEPPASTTIKASEEAALKVALGAYSATAPFPDGRLFVTETILKVPNPRSGPLAQLNHSPDLRKDSTDQRLRLFRRLGIEAFESGEYRNQQLLVDCLTGQVAELLRVEAEPRRDLIAGLLTLKRHLAPGVEVQIAGTDSKVTLTRRTNLSSIRGWRTEAVLLRDNALFRCRFYPSAHLVEIGGDAWEYSGSPDLKAVKDLKPFVNNVIPG